MDSANRNFTPRAMTVVSITPRKSEHSPRNSETPFFTPSAEISKINNNSTGVTRHKSVQLFESRHNSKLLNPNSPLFYSNSKDSLHKRGVSEGTINTLSPNILPKDVISHEQPKSRLSRSSTTSTLGSASVNIPKISSATKTAEIEELTSKETSASISSSNYISNVSNNNSIRIVNMDSSKPKLLKSQSLSANFLKDSTPNKLFSDSNFDAGKSLNNQLLTNGPVPLTQSANTSTLKVQPALTRSLTLDSITNSTPLAIKNQVSPSSAHSSDLSLNKTIATKLVRNNSLTSISKVTRARPSIRRRSINKVGKKPKTPTSSSSKLYVSNLDVSVLDRGTNLQRKSIRGHNFDISKLKSYSNRNREKYFSYSPSVIKKLPNLVSSSYDLKRFDRSIYFFKFAPYRFGSYCKVFHRKKLLFSKNGHGVMLEFDKDIETSKMKQNEIEIPEKIEIISRISTVGEFNFFEKCDRMCSIISKRRLKEFFDRWVIVVTNLIETKLKLQRKNESRKKETSLFTSLSNNIVSINFPRMFL